MSGTAYLIILPGLPDYSFAGSDVKLQVVDMFGAGLPVCARSFAALPECWARSESLSSVFCWKCGSVLRADRAKARPAWREWTRVQQHGGNTDLNVLRSRARCPRVFIEKSMRPGACSEFGTRTRGSLTLSRKPAKLHELFLTICHCDATCLEGSLVGFTLVEISGREARISATQLWMV